MITNGECKMKYIVRSDLHIDFFIDLWKRTEWGPIGDTKDYENVLPCFVKFYDMFLNEEADGIIIAGDVANDYHTQVNFLKFLGTKFKKVYYCFGNHDLCVVGHTFGNGNPFSKSEDRMQKVIDDFKNTNVHILENEMVDGIAGCMGMCSLTYRANYLATPEMLNKMWAKKWYDGRIWKYHTFSDGHTMNPREIYKHYQKIMDELVEKHPKVMMTHFCPLEMGMDRKYEGELSTAFFYFNAKDYLEKMDNDTYWICGHVHSAFKKDYVNAKGNTIHIICFPNAYPGENPWELNGLTNKDSIIEF